jgi:hypothetical protein
VGFNAYESELLNQSSVLLMKFSAIKSQLRVTANRNKQFKTNTRKKNENKLQKKKYEYQSNFRVDVVSLVLSEF